MFHQKFFSKFLSMSRYKQGFANKARETNARVFLEKTSTRGAQQQPAMSFKVRNSIVSTTVCWVLLIHPFQTSCILSSVCSSKKITCSLTRQLPEKLHMSVLSKTSSTKTISRKAPHDASQSPKKPGMPSLYPILH